MLTDSSIEHRTGAEISPDPQVPCPTLLLTSALRMVQLFLFRPADEDPKPGGEHAASGRRPLVLDLSRMDNTRDGRSRIIMNRWLWDMRRVHVKTLYVGFPPGELSSFMIYL